VEQPARQHGILSQLARTPGQREEDRARYFPSVLRVSRASKSRRVDQGSVTLDHRSQALCVRIAPPRRETFWICHASEMHPG
jgi:hypothetical protein